MKGLRFVAWPVAGAILMVALGCGRANDEARQAATPAPAPAPAGEYPAPRFPGYLRASASVDDLLPYTRKLVRNPIGYQGVGLGAIESGESIVLIASLSGSTLAGLSEDASVEAIKRALEERSVNVAILWEHEAAGVTRDDAVALRSYVRGFTSEHGFLEVAGWIDGQFPDPLAAKRWLQARRPDLYAKVFPNARELPENLKASAQKLGLDGIGAGVRRYLEAHPEVRGVFWGKAGAPWLRRSIHPFEEKFLGLLSADNHWDAMSAVGDYPGDVWLLAEEQTMEPIAHVDRIHITDPEGTDLSADIPEAAATNWARGVYERGHLYMFPTQATGRWAASVIDYPAFQKDGWVEREPMALANGVIGGTANHNGFFPQWKVHLEQGYVRRVEGGGIIGDVLREFLQYPHINDLTFPYHKRPGFWYLYEIASGTHPKAFRNPAFLEQGSLIPERQRSGALHWGLGITLHHNPNTPVKAPEYMAFTAKYNLPREHGFHTHTYFSTYKVRLRTAARWVTLIDRGRLKSLDNPEVRALASRYGNPDEILTEDWIPEVPGINAPGDYAAYAANPWPSVKRVIDKAVDGTYEHFFPPRPSTRPGATR